jgi:endonuclease/exonuclease/phosphatase family metal-dependent hydrolase
VGHVVAVAHVGEPQPVEASEPLAKSHQVGQGLAGMVLAREHVHNRYGGVRRELLQRLVGAGPHADSVHVARQHQGGVPRRLSPRELELVLPEHHGMASELVHGDLEGDPSPGRGPLEEKRHALPVERAGGGAVPLQLEGTLHEAADLLARKLLSGKEMPDHRGIVVRVLSWNLFHGRDFPPDPSLHSWRSRLLRTEERDATHVQVNRSLRREYGDWLAARSWEIALLQEAPPRWHSDLCERCHADGALALTSRNSLPRVRAAVADWNPDLVASGEGGSNQVLARHPARILDSRCLTLARFPERRRMLWTRLDIPGGVGLCAATLHATSHDRSASARELSQAASWATHWSGDAPLVLGGDFNLKPRERPEVFAALEHRFGLAPPTGAESIDHVLARGLEVVEAPRPLPTEEREIQRGDGLRIRLSDHPPVVASFGMK